MVDKVLENVDESTNYYDPTTYINYGWIATNYDDNSG